MDYARDMEIDPTGLDVEWLEQPRLTIRYAEFAVLTKKEADLAKERLEVVTATLDSEIRKDPERFGLGKITEAVVQSTIVLQKNHQEATQEYIEAKYEMDMARYAMQAISDRKDALENLVRLHGQQYFAGPNLPRDLDKEWEARNRQSKSDERVGKAMMRRRREAE